ncbi:hypothetical protein BDZ85DRAFT_258154 [Elsinoe ampelina]|uniref:NAD(P)-binding domain-containing protein n=1 Tax=Elsinoe ampelina TaxID=302913 RepID=A0A6A6GJR7_9PEZI|nr:hypothetical protein BDZ85DRAFT_258154 [Elsinoe ampelina]
MQQVDLLILGAGWTATFLLPLLRDAHLSHALTTTSGRTVDSTPSLKFKYDPSATDQSYFSTLPAARYVLITFPVKSNEEAAKLVNAYLETHPRVQETVRWIVLGSTGIWQVGSPYAAGEEGEEGPWYNRYSPYDRDNARALTEEEYLGRGAIVLNLSGLWGGSREPKNWVERVAMTKEQVKAKKSLHMIHGLDVGRAIVAVVKAWEADREEDECKRCHGQRWMLTDGFVYDWWSLFVGWADVGEGKEPSKQAKWVFELMNETGVKGLPRSMEELGRCYDTREFWTTFGLSPIKARI